jgi:3',5'-cyclic AMP phosphodiesterase CpdA
MSIVLQISDTHFGTEQQAVAEALLRMTSQQRPDLVVLSGDITQRATNSQFQNARAFVDGMGVQVMAIPGNHDIPLFNIGARLRKPYAHYSAAFGEVLEPAHASTELLVLCVNTTRWYRHKNGEVSAQQIDRVAQRLTQASANQLRVVVVHQPIAVVHAADRHDLLRGHAAAVASWSAAGADLVMGGHIHLPYVMAVPNCARAMWAVQAGTAVSCRVRDGMPNSVNLIRSGSHAPEGQCVIERWDYAAVGQAFIRGTVTVVKPGRSSNGN